MGSKKLLCHISALEGPSSLSPISRFPQLTDWTDKQTDRQTGSATTWFQHHPLMLYCN